MMKQGLIDPKKTELLVDFDSTGNFTKIVELTAIPFPTSSWTPADVTALDDMAKRVADAGVIENGVVEIRGLMISGSVQQNQIFVINRIKSCLCYKIVLSDPLHTTIEFYAFITNWSPSNTVGDKARVAFNLTIDGDVKFYNDNGMIWDGSGGGGDPEPPQISCAGATSYFGFQLLRGSWEVFVDGIQYGLAAFPPDIIRAHFDGIIQVENDGFADFWNLDNAPHRIEFRPADDSAVMPTLRPDNENTSFIELENGAIGFCLSPVVDGVIPTNRVVLSDLSPVHYDESWDVTINGITYPNLSIPRPSEGQVVVTNGLTDIFYKNLASIYEPLGLSVWWGHPRTCYLENSSSIPISIMLKPNNMLSDAVADATNNNPSVVKDTNRIIQFVLAASG